MIKIYKEKKINVINGDVYRVIDNQSKGYIKFGEAYFSFIKYNKIKGWKKHKFMRLNLIVPIGKVQFVFFNQTRKNFKKVIIGESNYKRLVVDPGYWFAFKGLSKKQNLILNISNIKHDPNETENIDLDNIKYNWK